MKVTKRDLERLVEDLEELIVEMEQKNVDEVTTSANTYGLNDNFISFGYNGYLDIQQAIETLISGENDDEW